MLAPKVWFNPPIDKSNLINKHCTLNQSHISYSQCGRFFLQYSNLQCTLSKFKKMLLACFKTDCPYNLFRNEIKDTLASVDMVFNTQIMTHMHLLRIRENNTCHHNKTRVEKEET